MSKFLADGLVDFFMQQGIIESKDESILRYGYEAFFRRAV